MSMEALRAIRPIKVSAPQKVLLWALADQANAAGEAWPSIASLVEATCLSERTVQVAIAALREAGHLSTEQGGGRYKTTTYKLNLPSETPQEVLGKSAQTPQLSRGNEGETPQLSVETPQELRETPQELHPNPQEPKKERKEEKKEDGRAVTLALDIPSWLPADVWADWVAHRKHIRKPMSAKAAEYTIRSIEKLRRQGHDPRALIELAIMSGWQGIYAPKGGQKPQPYRNGFVAVAERLANEESEPYDPDPNPFLTYEACPHVH